MKYSFLLFLILIGSINLRAQFFENFDDGDITNGVEWNGNTGNFKVNSDHQLQLNTSGEAVSYLSAHLYQGEVLEWSFWIKCTFSPSDNNHAIFYLLSDQADLNSTLNGFYLKFGESGSADAIELYRKSPNESVLVARGQDGFLKDPFTMKIKVMRDDGHWEIWADSTGSAGYKKQASGDDDYWQDYSSLGIVCRYTSSNATKFKFDDIYAGPRIIDAKPPKLLEPTVINSNEIELSYDEPLDPTAIQQLNNFDLFEDIGTPVESYRDDENDKVIHLKFADNMIEGQQYHLTIRNMMDLAGNKSKDTTINLTYYPIRQFDILINEIMADPEPALGLPECEYIELYNNTCHAIRLDNYKLISGTSVRDLPVINLPESGYCILTGTDCDSIMNQLGYAIEVPGLSVLNTGTTLTLKDANDGVVHQVEYDPTFYNNSLKESGGWALEQIDHTNPCGGFNNWLFSIDPSGGTPGRGNSVNSENKDKSSPSLMAVAVKDSITIKLWFNEVMDSIKLTNCSNYMADHGIGSPINAQLEDLIYDHVKLTFSKPFLYDSIYSLQVNDLLCDCAGNQLPASSILFGLPYPVDTNSIIINEILFDPGTSGTDFVELYNRSGHTVSLADLWIGLKNESEGRIDDACRISEQGRLIMPDEYVIVTAEPDLLKADYFSPNPAGYIKAPGFPLLPNSGGKLILCTSTGIYIDEAKFNEEMQFPLLNSTKGVSLERIDFNRPANKESNWHSASQNAGFATPAYRNSQFMQYFADEGQLTIEPDAISPDNDGYNDVLSVICKPGKPDCLITIRIFDSEGRAVKVISLNNLSGETANFTWDGTDDKNEVVNSGIYVVLTEFVSLNGSVSKSRKAIVVTGY
ncbi:MAG TPA: lamin tail domain-containing protein [Lentimicrobium sp.]|nr:lamin tail domain-containing protein [Lentimicrobium sp.]